jgi:hypothetical protein
MHIPEVGNQLTIQSDRFVVVDGSHLIAVKVGGDGSQVDQGDLFVLEVFECLKCLNNLGMNGLARNPCLVFFSVLAALFDYSTPRNLRSTLLLEVLLPLVQVHVYLRL